MAKLLLAEIKNKIKKKINDYRIKRIGHSDLKTRVFAYHFICVQNLQFLQNCVVVINMNRKK